MYRIIGSDHKIYGPVSAAQLRAWLAEGRINAATLVLPEGGAEWKALSSLPEFAAPPPAMTPPPPSSSAPQSNGMATAGLTFGILSNLCCCLGWTFGILGIIFSAVALNQIENSPLPRPSGKSTATAGLIISIVGVIWHSFIPLWFGLLSGVGTFGHHFWRFPH